MAAVGLLITARGAPSRILPQDLTSRVWTKQQGLPDDSVTAVLQTRDGYLWVGTSSGLARFDGVRFVTMPSRSAKTNSSICVTTLCEDSAGRLWIGTQGEGLLCFSKGVLSQFFAKEFLPTETINSIVEDAGTKLWLGTPSGLARIEEGRVTWFTTRDGLPNDFVSSVHVARSGTVWITTRGGMCQFKNGQIHLFPFQTDSPGRNPESLGVYEDRRGNLWAFGDTYLVNLTEGKHLNHFGGGDTTSSMRIWSLCEGRRGELWIGTSGKGLYCFTDDRFVPISLRNGGLTSDVRALCEDREGNLWLGTYGSGLVRLQPRNLSVLDASIGLPKRTATCLALDGQDRLWIGFEREGLFAGVDETFATVANANAELSWNLLSSVCVAPDSSVWIATPGAGLYRMADHRIVHYTTADGLSDDSVLAVAADSEGAVWAGTASGGLHRFANGKVTTFDADAGLPGQPVTAILPARSGGLWIGFAGGHIVRANHNDFRAVPTPAIKGKTVRALSEDPAGRLWFGTSDGIVGCIDDNRFLNWKLNWGAPEDSIVGIVNGDEGDLWLNTDTAIYRLGQSEITNLLTSQISFRPQLVFKTDSPADTAASYGWPRVVKSVQGKLWFGMSSGVVVFDTRGAVNDSTPPPVVIEQISVDGQPFVPAKESRALAKEPNAPTRLVANLRSLEIEFTALNLSAPEKTRFRYRLDGFDPDWVNGGAGRSVHYGQLPFGTYTFRVQAGATDQAWYANEASFRFLIPTPLWRTNWALAVYGIVALSLVAGTVRLISHRRYQRRLAAFAAQQAMERERMRIAQDMHDEIGSKLTKISFMSELAKGELEGQEPVARKLSSIAHTSRDLLQSLDEIVWAVNPSNDTLEHVAAYLGQYATEYLQNTAVECELHIPQGLPHQSFSAEMRHNLFLAFEESLNNALKHGKASRVRIEMRIADARFEIQIQDNGCGFDANKLLSAEPARGARGNGLRNMRQRLGEIGGKCVIRSEPGAGATVTLSAPLRAASAQ